jgi:hypothetical protein
MPTRTFGNPSVSSYGKPNDAAAQEQSVVLGFSVCRLRLHLSAKRDEGLSKLNGSFQEI